MKNSFYISPFLIFSAFWLVLFFNASIGLSQSLCYTVSPSSQAYPPPQGESGGGGCYPEVDGPFYVRIYVHMIVRDDGSGGYEESVVREAINLK